MIERKSTCTVTSLRRTMYFKDKTGKDDFHTEMLDMEKLKNLGFSHSVDCKTVNIDPDTGKKTISFGVPVFMLNGVIIDDIKSYREMVEYHFFKIVTDRSLK